MALSLAQQLGAVRNFPIDRLKAEANNPGSTGMPGGVDVSPWIVIQEMNRRNYEFDADANARAEAEQREKVAGPPSGETTARREQNAFGQRFGNGEGSMEGIPPGGGPSGPPPGMPPPGMPPGGPPGGMPGPPPGPPPMAYGGLVGLEEGGFFSGLGRMVSGAGSWEEAAKNPFRTAARTALSGAMLLPGLGVAGMGLRGLSGLMKGARASSALRKLGGQVLRLEGKGGLRGKLARGLGSPASVSLPKRRLLASTVERGRRMSPGATALVDTGAIGRKALLRGGGALGITGLIALDPFDENGEEKEVAPPPPSTHVNQTNAVRTDTEKQTYPWMEELTQPERDYRRRYGEATPSWLERDISDLDWDWDRDIGSAYYPPGEHMASGGIVGLQTGGEMVVTRPDTGSGGGIAAAARQRLREKQEEDRRRSLQSDWAALGQNRPALDQWLAMSDEQRSQTVPRHKDRQRQEFLEQREKTRERFAREEVTAEQVLALAEEAGISGEEALGMFYPGGFLPTEGRVPQRLREDVMGIEREPIKFTPDPPVGSTVEERLAAANGNGAGGTGIRSLDRQEEKGDTAFAQAMDMWQAEQDALRRETPEEKALREASERERDYQQNVARRTALFTGLSDFAGGRRTLTDAAKDQEAIHATIAGLEAAELQEGATRSRASTIDQQGKILELIGLEAGRMHGISETGKNALRAAYMQIQAGQQLTPKMLLDIRVVTEELVATNNMEREDANKLVELLMGQYLGQTQRMAGGNNPEIAELIRGLGNGSDNGSPPDGGRL